ncbi:MAG: DUF2946 family protein [Lautropia sp.]
MDRLRRARQFAGWLVLAAVLALVAAPTLSRLSRPGQGSWPSSPICSATNPMSQGNSGETGSRDGVEHQSCCALCAFGIAALPAPPSAGVMALVSARIAPAFTEARKFSRGWAHAPSRGPPSPD